MKNINFYYSKYDFDFKNAIESIIDEKWKIADLLLQSIKYMLTNDTFTKSDGCNYFTLYVNKMSRLFFWLDDKYFSITFPCEWYNNEVKMITPKGGQVIIDNKLSSVLLRVVSETKLSSEVSYDEILESYLQYDELVDDIDDILDCVSYLKTFESGYLRFDIDKNASERKNPHTYYHMDINYTLKAQWKVALSSKFKKDDFIDILDICTVAKSLK